MNQVKKVPRGIRNNNPLNIRQGNCWLGEVPADEVTDGSFEQFVSMEYGIRAAVVLLRRYFLRYKRRTITAIISAWAPETENLTANYIKAVSQRTGFAPDAEILWCEANIVKLVEAMAFVENGQEVDEKVIRKGFRLA